MSEQEIPLHWFQEYDGKHVCVQMRDVLYTVTAPGTFVPIKNPEGHLQDLHKMPVVAGTAKFVVDQKGNCRLVIRTADPNPDTGANIHVSLGEEDIASISLVEEQSIVGAP